MLRNPNLKNNPNSLAGVPSDWDFWKNLELDHVRTLLSKPLLKIDGLTALPEHENLRELLNNALKRVNNCATEAMLKDCIKWLRTEDIRGSKLKNAEAFMQLKGLLSFYTGDVVEAAKYLGIIADAYFLNHRVETDFMSSLFNKVAGIEYERLGNVDKACHHYRQYLTILSGASHTPEEVYAATKYLLAHKQLVRTNDSVSLLEQMKDQCGSNLALALKYGRLIPEVKLLSMSDKASRNGYFEVGEAEAKNSLNHSIEDVLAVDLVTKVAVAKYLADKAAAAAPAPSAPPAEYVQQPRHGR